MGRLFFFYVLISFYGCFALLALSIILIVILVVRRKSISEAVKILEVRHRRRRWGARRDTEMNTIYYVDHIRLAHLTSLWGI
jgi:hypothetical protein